MGRAHEVRKAAMAKTAAAKTKVYSKYGKEILIAAKAGVPDPEMNLSLKRIIEKAKKDQVPSDIIKRAIDKAKSGAGEDYSPVTYEGFGPGASTIIIECLTDNVNRTVSDVKTCFNKSHAKMGVNGCVSHSYQHVSLLSLKGMSEEEVLDALMEANVDVLNIEEDEGEILLTGSDTDLYNMKTALERPGVEFDIEKISWETDEKVTLEGEELELFERLLTNLDGCDDVQEVYHNVELD